MRVLLSAYACNPNKGSEGGVGWNWLKEISKRNEVWVLFYQGQGQQEALDAAISELSYKNNIHLVPITVPSFFRRSLYRFRYEIWQWIAYQKAKELSREMPFDLVHHVTIAAWWNCGYLWKLNIPFIFGPISGGQRSPKQLYSLLRPQDVIYEWTRDRLIDLSWLLWQRPRIAIKNASIVFAANTETLSMVQMVRNDKPVILFTEIGMDHIHEKEIFPVENHSGINILWVGNLIPIKNFGLLLEVLKKIGLKHEWHLRVIGDGFLRGYWREKSFIAGLDDRIAFYGAIDHHEVEHHYQWADVLVFPSTREATGTVILEAMSHGVPVITLDMNGAKTVIDSTCGILIPVINHKQVVNDFQSAILKLCHNPELRKSLGDASRIRVEENFLWEKRGCKMNDFYKQIKDIKERDNETGFCRL